LFSNDEIDALLEDIENLDGNLSVLESQMTYMEDLTDDITHKFENIDIIDV
jgi:hypothetical protein